MNDTPPEIRELVQKRLMAIPGAERVQMASRMFDAARQMAIASFPAGLNEIQMKQRLFERVYGEPLPKGMLPAEELRGKARD
jgi:hypothetical protein